MACELGLGQEPREWLHDLDFELHGDRPIYNSLMSRHRFSASATNIAWGFLCMGDFESSICLACNLPSSQSD